MDLNNGRRIQRMQHTKVVDSIEPMIGKPSHSAFGNVFDGHCDRQHAFSIENVIAKRRDIFD